MLYTTTHRPLQTATEYFTAQRYVEAEELCRTMLTTEPGNPEVLNLAGLLATNRDDFAAAENYFKMAIAAAPAMIFLYNNMGLLYTRQGRLTDALDYYEQALRRVSTQPEILSNKALTLVRLCKIEEAITCYRQALQYDPHSAIIHNNYGLALILAGNCKDGWREIESRWRPEANRFRQPAWQGEPLAGKTIYVHTEQGLGDTIQYVRFMPQLHQLGAHVIVNVQPELRPLLCAQDGYRAISNQDPIPEFDIQCWSASLPHLFKLTEQSLLYQEPYLRADAGKIDNWRGKLAHITQKKVGLVWAGNPKNPHDADRSISFEQLAPLFKVAGAAWINLQKGPAAGQFSTIPAGVASHDASAQLHDFSDTAALISQLDVVIGVDTSVAHLAGALGKPTYMMIQWSPDSRWHLQRADTPWYPTMRLFRQPQRGQWRPVIEQVAAKLADSL